MKIISEIIGFFLDVGIKSIYVDLDEKTVKNTTIIQISGIVKHNIEEEIKELKKALASPREESTEEYFWELVGGESHPEELVLVGMMIDKSEVVCENERLSVKLYRAS